MDQTKQSIELWRQLAEKALNWGNSDSWTDQDFERLSESIFGKTGVQLSVSTLKRIWGKVQYNSTPAHSTLNVLARFSGYDSWRDFQQKHPVTPSQGATPPQQPRPEKRKKTLPRFIPFTAIALAITGLAFLLIKGKSPEPPHSVQFESRVISDDLPNSVVFTYDVADFKSRNVMIQQSWDPRRREKVDGEGHQHTSIYYYPGHFKAKLLVDGEIKKEHVVFIKTKGWKGFIDKDSIPAYLHPKETIRPGSMGVSSAVLREKTGSPVFNNTWVAFQNVREFNGLQSKAFTLEASLRNSSTMEESICRKAVTVVMFTDGGIAVPLSTPGCISDLNVGARGNIIEGRKHDLSAFGCDFKDFQQLKCQIKDQRLMVFLNNKLILNEEEKRSLGEIIGLGFAFEGAGEVQYVKLSGPAGTVYEERF